MRGFRVSFHVCILIPSLRGEYGTSNEKSADPPPVVESGIGESI